MDGVIYEEFFISDYDTNVNGLYDRLGEYESLDELNYLAALLSDMDTWELDQFEAALALGGHGYSVTAIINLTQNLDCFSFYPGVTDSEELGRILIEDMGLAEIPEWMTGYFDYGAYGRDFAIDEGGEFVDGGYIVDEGGFIEHYGGREDIPDEYRIFAYPDPPERMPMKQQLEMYSSMQRSQALADKPAPSREER